MSAENTLGEIRPASSYGDLLVFGEAVNYDDIQKAMRWRADMLKRRRKDIDALAYWPDGLAEKTLSEKPLRRLGPATIGDGLRTLGLKLLVVEDAEGLARTMANSEPRDESQVRNSAQHTAAVLIKIKPRFLRKIGAIGGKNSRKYISRRKASALGRKAMRARWRKWKANKESKKRLAPATD